MKITKEKVIGVIVLIAVCIPFTAWKESKVNDFPVSIFSEEADGEYDQKLKYTAFLPDVAIWMNGWEKEVDRRGKNCLSKRESHCKCVSSSWR